MSTGIDHLQRPAKQARTRQDESRAVGRFGLAPIAVYVAVVGIWLGFGVILLQGMAGVEDLWDRYRALPPAVVVTVGLLLLPWVLAVGIWQADWPIFVRAGLDGLLALLTLVMFFPVKLSIPRESNAGNRDDTMAGATRVRQSRSSSPRREA